MTHAVRDLKISCNTCQVCCCIKIITSFVHWLYNFRPITLPQWKFLLLSQQNSFFNVFDLDPIGQGHPKSIQFLVLVSWTSMPSLKNVGQTVHPQSSTQILQTDWLTDSLTHWLTDWLTDCHLLDISLLRRNNNNNKNNNNNNNNNNSILEKL